MSINLRTADKYILTGLIPQVFTCESAEAFIEMREANPNFTLADLAFLTDQTEEVWADIWESGAVYVGPPSGALEDQAIGGTFQEQEGKIMSDPYEPPVPARSSMGEFDSLLSVHPQKGIYERPKDNFSPHRPSKTVLVKGTFTPNPRMKGPQGVQLSKFKQVQGHQRSQIFTNPSSRVLERPKMSSQDIRYNAPSQNYERIRTGGNIGGATAKNSSCDEGNYFQKSSKFGESTARALSGMHISGEGGTEVEEYGEQRRQSNVRFDRGCYSTEPKEISLPYTEYSPSRSSSEYDHPRKANNRRSSQKYRSAEGDEYSRSPSLHRTKLKSSRTSRTEYSDRSHRSPSTKFGRSPSQRRKGKYEHYQRRSPSPSYSRRSPSPYTRHSSSRHSHSRAKSKAGRKYSPDKHYEHSSRSHSHRYRSPSRRYRSSSDSSYSSSDSGSSFGRNDSSSEDSSPDRRRRSHRQSHRHERRQRSPPMPKMAVFKCDKTWDSFIFQFERVADRCGWSSRKQAEKLVDCLGGKALEYVRELRLEEDFTRMKGN